MIQEAMLKTWALEKDVLIGEVTRHALEAGCDRMLLVCRQVLKKRWDYCSPQAAEVAGKLLAPYSLKTLTTTAWPGTVLKKEADGHQAKVFIYRFGPSLAQVLSGIGPMLLDWKHGGRHDLPEDLCLWRDGEALPSKSGLSSAASTCTATRSCSK
jgi:hypothetical protein